MFYFTPLFGVLFTFPSRYCFSIAHTGVFSLTEWSRRIHMEFHVLHATRESACISLQSSTTGLSPSVVHLFNASSDLEIPCCCPTTPKCMHFGLGCSLFAHHYWGNLFRFLFLRLLRCFSSPGSLIPTYFFCRLCFGLPHSDTSGSMLASSSPERFVGRHVLLRLCVARYPPQALFCLTDFFFVCAFTTYACVCSFHGSGWVKLLPSSLLLLPRSCWLLSLFPWR